MQIELLSSEVAVRNGRHNAFPSMCSFQDKLFIAFRQASSRRLRDGLIVLCSSIDRGKSFQQIKCFSGRGDMRDPRLCVVNDNLMLYIGCSCEQADGKEELVNIAYGSADGENFCEFTLQGLQKNTFIRSCVPYQTGYVATGCRKSEGNYTSFLYRSGDGINWQHWLTLPRNADETSLTTGKDNVLYGIACNEVGHMLPEFFKIENDQYIKIATLNIPLQEVMLQSVNDSFVTVSRCWDWCSEHAPLPGRRNVRTDVCTLDKSGQLDYALTLPSSGDCSYAAGLQIDDELVLVYYSQHYYNDFLHKLDPAQLPVTPLPGDIYSAVLKLYSSSAPELDLVGRTVKFSDCYGCIYLPENFDPATAELLLFFHGRGGQPGKGGNAAHEGFARFRQLCRQRNTVIAVPGCGPDSWANDQAMDIAEKMVKYLAVTYRINTQKYAVIGCSMGGNAALVYSAGHRTEVRAVCDIFGMTDLLKLIDERPVYRESILAALQADPADNADIYSRHSALSYVETLKDLPLLILHGQKDAIVNIHHSRDLAAAISQAGGTCCKLCEVPAAGHDNNIVRGWEERIVDFLQSGVFK